MEEAQQAWWRSEPAGLKSACCSSSEKAQSEEVGCMRSEPAGYTKNEPVECTTSEPAECKSEGAQNEKKSEPVECKSEEAQSERKSEEEQEAHKSSELAWAHSET